MALALRLAARAAGRTRPNPMVGCVIVKDGEILGQGYHPCAGAPHAEVFALREAGEGARGACAYVTLEPCSHFGRTPPCADALIKAGVGRVVVAMVDPNLQVSGRGVARLRESGIEVVIGVREAEAQELNRPFVTWIEQERPMITLKSAASLDGKTATRTGESQWITGPIARKRVQRMRDVHDVVMVGIGTVLADDPSLTCRMHGGRDPVRLVVDSRLRIPEDARVFTSSQTAPLWIATGHSASFARAEALGARENVRVIPCRETREGRVNLVDMMHRLADMDVTSVLCEAGGVLTGALLEAGLADRLALFLAPKLIGGRDARGILEMTGIGSLADAQRLVRTRICHVGEDILIEGDFEATRCLLV
ncbi:MAG: bifunctional diaminohydroxyphosphoribosylaminopyrimidine deaminase/5-amino-6-(5-phosphoribosylamino)uracil reductase RibD [Magnetococcales bacterium]|nr:bifunctional diaminohydroxyphosphoribosylaminopyrimidine deaminase/5-amino-6-(5-phosphoribosylamino)uracil reductase RibD [Magnetococcales bacterium]